MLAGPPSHEAIHLALPRVFEDNSLPLGSSKAESGVSVAQPLAMKEKNRPGYCSFWQWRWHGVTTASALADRGSATKARGQGPGSYKEGYPVGALVQDLAEKQVAPWEALSLPYPITQDVATLCRVVIRHKDDVGTKPRGG